MAADLPMAEPTYAPPAPVEVMSVNPWEGGYVGAAAGWTWTETDSNNGAASVDADGVSVGGFAGYNFAYNNFVFGPELSANYNDIDETSATSRFESSWDTELRMRLGYDMGSILPYAAVGVGLQDAEMTDRFTGASDDNTHTFVGLTGGVEAMVSENVSVRAEAGYRWSDEQTYNFGTYSSKTSADGAVAKVGLSYHF